MMYLNDHPPAHFHAFVGEHRAVIEIETLTLTRGELPRAKLRAVLKWATTRKRELMRAWDLTQSQRPAGVIE